MKRIIVVLFVIGLLFTAAFAADNAGTGRVSGTIMLKDSGPMADGMVLFFSDSIGPPPLDNKYMRAPEIIAVTDSRGSFSAGLPAGRYYIGGNKHNQKKWNGPPRDGDLFFISKDDTDILVLYTVKAGESLNINITAEDKPYEWPDVRQGITGIEGRIHDMHGNPVNDAVVFGYLKPSMNEGLAFVSGYTDSDGKYLLRVHKGGNYYLMVMGEFGTVSTVSGMIINHGSDEVEDGINVATGEIMNNVDIALTIP